MGVAGRAVRASRDSGFVSVTRRTLHASRVRTARRRLRSDARAIRSASAGGHLTPSLCATASSTDDTSSTVGAATRRQRQRERIGAITLHGLVHTRSSRHVAVYLEGWRRLGELRAENCARRPDELRAELRAAAHFSIVRRSACCAGFDMRSTSLRTTTLNAGPAPATTDADCAISLITSCTTSRSRVPASLGLSSMWCDEHTSVRSTGVAEAPTLKVRCSTRSRSTDEPNISRSSAISRVFLPAPDGPYSSMCGKSPPPTIRLSCDESGLW